MSNASLEKGGGDVVGPGSGVVADDEVARWDGTSGALLKGSVVTINDAGACDGMTQLDVDNLRLDGLTLSSTNTDGNIIVQPNGAGVVNVNTTVFKVEEALNDGATIMRVFNPGTGAAEAKVRTTVGSASTGDPFLSMEVNTVRAFAFGIDNSDSDILKINTTNSTTVTPSDGTNLWNMTVDGENTMPLQPAFMARLNTTETDVTGDSTIHKIIFDTSIYDQGGSDYGTGTGNFTAPVTGKYQLNTSVRANQPTTQTIDTLFMTTSNNQIQLADFNGNTYKRTNGNWALSGGHVMDMDAADTANVNLQVQGAVLDVDILGGGSATFFSGSLIC